MPKQKQLEKINGFTLLEIMVVLAIFAVLFGLGVVAYTNYLRSSMLNEASNQVITVLKETQNMAKNNTLPKNQDASARLQNKYYYVIEFKDNNIVRYLLSLNNVGKWGTVAMESKLKLDVPIKSASYGKSNTECSLIMFEMLTGKLHVWKAPAQIPTIAGTNLINSSQTSCDLTVYVPDDIYSKIITVNASEGNFGYKN